MRGCPIDKYQFYFQWITLLFMLSVFLYNAAVLRVEGSKSPISDFLLIEILRFAKVGKSKQSSFTHDLAPALVYEPLDSNTRIVIFMPTSKCSMPVAGSRFLLAFDRSSRCCQMEPNKVRHSLTRLGSKNFILIHTKISLRPDTNSEFIETKIV